MHGIDMNLHQKKTTLIALLLSPALFAVAEPVTPNQAMEAINRYRTVNRKMRKSPAGGELKLAYTQTSANGNCFYVFNNADGSGFTIASADDRLPAVLGFSDNGNFDFASANDNLRYWLDEYTREISEFLKKDPDVAPFEIKARPVDKAPIDPLCTTKWDQGKPFNNDCPYDSRAHATSYTGCVATAMAQVMKYHNWPVNPTGSRNGYIFSNTTLKWDDMIDVYEDRKYSGTEAAAVAQLMRQCGASVDMMYSAYGSGAYENDVQVAWRTYFDYDPNLELHYRDYYTYSEWNNMVYEEIANNGPVFYCGQSNAGGHAFVCDGYLGNNFYHFNWGWGGYQDGYFLLNALNPATGGAGSSAGGYNANQSIITGLKKNQHGTTHLQELAISTGAFTYSGGKFIVSNDPDNINLIYNPLATTLTATFGVKIMKFDGTGDPRYVASGSKTLSRWNGFRDMTVTMPSLSDGKYKVTPAMRTSWGEWKDVGVPYGFQRYVTMEVKGGKASYLNEGPPADQVSQLVAGEPMMVSKLYENAGDAVRVTVTNIGDGDFMGKVYITLEDSDDIFGDSFSADKWVSIPSHFSLDIDFTSDYQLPAANYLVEIIDTNYSLLYSGKIVKVEPSEFEYFEPGDVYIEEFGPRFYTESADGVGFVFTVHNEKKSDATLDVNLEIADMADLKIAKTLKAEGIVIEKQSEQLINFAKATLDLSPGGYYVFVKDGNGNMLCPPVPFSVMSDRKEANGIYYTVVSEADKKAMIVSPATSDYSGRIVIPAVIGDGYTVESIKADAFTFAENMESVTIPASVKTLQDGTFYFADGLRELHCDSTEPASVYQYAFGPEIAPNVVVFTPAGCANYYAAQENWSVFRISNWTISCGDDVEITGGLLINPVTNNYYSPYYVSADEALAIVTAVPAGKSVKAVWTLSDGTTASKVFESTALLPALNGLAGEVVLSATDESGVDVLDADFRNADVYGVDGTLVLKNADRNALTSLRKGIYIVNGRKVKL